MSLIPGAAGNSPESIRAYAAGEVIRMHSEVLGVVDAHLSELQALRRALVAARPIDAGERLRITAAAASSARRCAEELNHLLTGEAADHRYRSRASAA
ncbi:hypothetical protein Adi01nite_72380 [Amorphoplanes digitatis]|nr:hypothetical protein Adi01nite_72380 [Actinoplanes digitatis]